VLEFSQIQLDRSKLFILDGQIDSGETALIQGIQSSLFFYQKII